MPSIVDERMRLAVLNALKNAKRWARRNVQHDYLLRTMVVCGACNHRMDAIHQVSGNRRYEYFYYACSHRDPIITGREDRCTSRRVPADTLDSLVWDAAASWIQSPEMLLREVDAWRSGRASTQSSARDRARAENAHRQLDAQVDRLIDAYQRGAISVDELKARRERLEAAREVAREHARDLAAQDMNRDRIDRVGNDLQAFASTLRSGLGELDFAGRQRLVRLLTRQDRLHAYVAGESPLDVVGWDGTVYPVAFPILKFQPRVGLVHLPPTWHGTFAGSGALVCSFVPRPVDFHPQAIPCPYPHSNVEVDEVIFYCSGGFTSRRGIGAGSVSFHPAGIAHGPQGDAYERSIGTQSTDELAVMLDVYKPLCPTDQALEIEDTGYPDSFG